MYLVIWWKCHTFGKLTHWTAKVNKSWCLLNHVIQPHDKCDTDSTWCNQCVYVYAAVCWLYVCTRRCWHMQWWCKCVIQQPRCGVSSTQLQRIVAHAAVKTNELIQQQQQQQQQQAKTCSGQQKTLLTVTLRTWGELLSDNGMAYPSFENCNSRVTLAAIDDARIKTCLGSLFLIHVVPYWLVGYTAMRKATIFYLCSVRLWDALWIGHDLCIINAHGEMKEKNPKTKRLFWFEQKKKQTNKQTNKQNKRCCPALFSDYFSSRWLAIDYIILKWLKWQIATNWNDESKNGIYSKLIH